MIKFNSTDDNKQYISITVKDGTSSDIVADHIINYYPSVGKICELDEDEILIPLENNIDYGFSLNELRATVAEIAKVDIYNFCVDIEMMSQRYNGN